MTTALDRFLPTYDLVITERLVIDQPCHVVFAAAGTLDFMRVRTPLLVAAMFVRGLPARIRGHAPPKPPELRLINETNDVGLPGWLLLDVTGDEIAFGAVGKFWKASIEWRDVTVEEFTAFDEPGWGKIGCHFFARSDGPAKSLLTYECRVATTDDRAKRQMARYWWLIRPFVGHIMRATLRTVSRDATLDASTKVSSATSMA